MNDTQLAELERTFQQQGPDQALQQLCDALQKQREYGGLFYALLMKKRHELGMAPIATGNNLDIPADKQEAFTEGIRQAARTVGQLFLDDGDIPAGWSYFRMLNETGPVARAIEAANPGPDDDVQPLIDIAFHQGVLPARGFDWVLSRYGLCSTITMMNSESQLAPEVRADCIKKLVRALHGELIDRLRIHIEQQQNFAPSGTTAAALIEGRDWLFGEDSYHIDLSHLNSVIQMAMQLDPCDEFQLARDLCAYGKKVSPRFRYQTDPPFEDQYVDYDAYLAVLTGEEVEGGLAHFRAKADNADPETIGTFPAEVLVNLLLRIDRTDEALAVARKHLAQAGERRLSCPNLIELCQQTGRYDLLRDVAREQGHAVNFVAGLLGSKEARGA